MHTLYIKSWNAKHRNVYKNVHATNNNMYNIYIPFYRTNKKNEQKKPN